MLRFLINNWSPIISTIALLLSIFVIFTTRKRLFVSIESPQTVYHDLTLVSNNGDTVEIGIGYLVSFVVLNSSPNDIGYFDLVANNTVSNCRYSVMTQKSIEATYPNFHKTKAIYNNQEIRFSLTIPEANSGVFKANSLTRLDLFVVPTGIADNESIDVSFKATIYALFRTSKHSVVKKRKHFRAYSQRIVAAKWSQLHK